MVTENVKKLAVFSAANVDEKVHISTMRKEVVNGVNKL
jgi:hypothetical protein